jgi:hypothetical protein
MISKTIDFITKYAGVFFVSAGFSISLGVMLFTALLAPNIISSFILLAMILFIKGQFIVLLIEEFKRL